jgi:hypothetical protein
MGMLFNTETTIQVLEMVNSAFRPVRLIPIQTAVNAGTPPSWATNLKTVLTNLAALTTTTPAPKPTIYGLATTPPFFIDFDRTDQNSAGFVMSNRWQSWLGFLDTTQNSSGQFLSAVIAQAVLDSISDPTRCKGVEFFATPGAGINAVAMYVAPGAAPSATKPASGSYVRIIQVTTDILDRLQLGVLDRRHR